MLSDKAQEEKFWGGNRESNPQPPEPQSGALPVELFPPHLLIIATEIRDCQNRRAPASEIQDKNVVIPTGAQRGERSGEPALSECSESKGSQSRAICE